MVGPTIKHRLCTCIKKCHMNKLDKYFVLSSLENLTILVKLGVLLNIFRSEKTSFNVKQKVKT